MCHPRQARHHPAKGHTTCPSVTRRLGGSSLILHHNIFTTRYPFSRFLVVRRVCTGYVGEHSVTLCSWIRRASAVCLLRLLRGGALRLAFYGAKVSACLMGGLTCLSTLTSHLILIHTLNASNSVFVDPGQQAILSVMKPFVHCAHLEELRRSWSF